MFFLINKEKVYSYLASVIFVSILLFGATFISKPGDKNSLSTSTTIENTVDSNNVIENVIK